MKVLLVVAFLVCGGCATREVPGLVSAKALKENRVLSTRVAKEVGAAASVELISISPYPPGPPGPIAVGHIDQFPIVGEIGVSQKEDIAKLAESLAKGISSADGEWMMCFNPRHAIRYEAHGKSVVLLVCFECRKGEIRTDGEKIEFMTSPTPEAS